MQDQEMTRLCRGAVEVWRDSGEVVRAGAYGIEWTYETALEFVRALSRMFQAYNQVLWEAFPFCRLCLGQCCKVEASYVSLFDGLAMSLLDRCLPQLGEEIQARPEQCIYLTRSGCSWPAEWTDFKCRLFYCLGPEGRRMEASAAQKVYTQMARKLEDTLQTLLPEALRRYEQASGVELIYDLEDPLGFTERLGEALDEIFTEPVRKRFPGIWDGRRPEHYLSPESQENRLSPAAAQALEFIGQAGEELYLSGQESVDGISTKQLLEDLETLEGIILGQQGKEKLEEMAARYANVMVERGGFVERMRAEINKLRQKTV